MDFSGKRALVVSSDFPYPPNHGGRLDIWGRIKALYGLGFEIDLLATIGSMPARIDIEAAHKRVKKVILCHRQLGIADFFQLEPIQLRSRQLLKKVTVSGQYDLVLLESEYVLKILDNPGLHAETVVLRIHNDEALYLLELSKSEHFSLRKIYYLVEALRCFFLRPMVKKRIANMLFISQDELDAFSQRNPKTNAAFLPPPLSSPQRVKKEWSSSKVLFIGALFMPNNREAIEWYCENVHTHLLDIDGYELIIGGNSRGQKQWWVNRLSGLDRITFYDSPADLRPLYEESGIFINPLLHGAGVKLKVIDAILNGLPVVTTSKGAQGTGLRNNQEILIADDPLKFAACMRNLLKNKHAGENLVLSAQRFLREKYDHQAILKSYLLPLIGTKKMEGVVESRQ